MGLGREAASSIIGCMVVVVYRILKMNTEEASFEKKVRIPSSIKIPPDCFLERIPNNRNLLVIKINIYIGKYVRINFIGISYNLISLD